MPAPLRRRSSSDVADRPQTLVREFAVAHRVRHSSQPEDDVRLRRKILDDLEDGAVAERSLLQEISLVVAPSRLRDVGELVREGWANAALNGPENPSTA